MRWTVTAIGFVAIVLTGCGSSSDATTVIKEVASPVQAHAAHAPKSHPQKGSPPNVVGLTLDVAEELLEEAGYRVSASNTDTSFGVVIPSHFTVCKQSDPRGPVVPVLAQKYGC